MRSHCKWKSSMKSQKDLIFLQRSHFRCKNKGKHHTFPLCVKPITDARTTLKLTFPRSVITSLFFSFAIALHVPLSVSTPWPWRWGNKWAFSPHWTRIIKCFIVSSRDKMNASEKRNLSFAPWQKSSLPGFWFLLGFFVLLLYFWNNGVKQGS